LDKENSSVVAETKNGRYTTTQEDKKIYFSFLYLDVPKIMFHIHVPSCAIGI
jgi:hypothetical protein